MNNVPGNDETGLLSTFRNFWHETLWLADGEAWDGLVRYL